MGGGVASEDHLTRRNEELRETIKLLLSFVDSQTLSVSAKLGAVSFHGLAALREEKKEELGEPRLFLDTHTEKRPDGSTVSMPSGEVVAPPYWVQMVIERIESLEGKIEALLEQHEEGE